MGVLYAFQRALRGTGWTQYRVLCCLANDDDVSPTYQIDLIRNLPTGDIQRSSNVSALLGHVKLSLESPVANEWECSTRFRGSKYGKIAADDHTANRVILQPAVTVVAPGAPMIWHMRRMDDYASFGDKSLLSEWEIGEYLAAFASAMAHVGCAVQPNDTVAAYDVTWPRVVDPTRRVLPVMIGADITLTSFTSLLHQLVERLGAGYRVDYARRAEGGVQIDQWPGGQAGEEKLVRIVVGDNGDGGCMKCRSGVYGQSKCPASATPTHVHYARRARGNLKFDAYEGAMWTDDEIRACLAIFGTHGMIYGTWNINRQLATDAIEAVDDHTRAPSAKRRRQSMNKK